MREDVRDMLVEAGHIVRYFDDHPFGLGVYTFRDTLIADSVSGLTFELDDITTITFFKHDEAKNMRVTTFGRETWFLYLGFPLNYQTTQIISLWRTLVCFPSGRTPVETLSLSLLELRLLTPSLFQKP
jgi:hypothetical protein